MRFPKDAVVIDDDDGEDIIMFDGPPTSKGQSRAKITFDSQSEDVSPVAQPMSSCPIFGTRGRPVSNPQELSNSNWKFPRRSSCMLISPSIFEIVDSPPPEGIVKAGDTSIYVADPHTHSSSIEHGAVSRAASVATTCTLGSSSPDPKGDEPDRQSSPPSSPPFKRRRRIQEPRDNGLSIDDIESTGRSIRQVTVDDIQHYIPHAAIVIEDDEAEFLEESTNSKGKDRRIPEEGDVVIDLDQIEAYLLRELEAREREAARGPRRSTVIPPRNIAIKHPFVLWGEDVEAKNGEILRSGKTAEVQGLGELRKDATFLYITAVIKNVETEQFTFRGHLLLRSRDLNGILSKKCNELVWSVEVDLDDPRNDTEQSLSEVALDNILGSREVRFTNQLYPSCSFRGQSHDFHTQEELDNFAPLVVRWKFVRKYSSARDRHNNRNVESSLVHLREEDVLELCPRLAIKDLGRREQHRGNTVLGGTHIPGQERPSVRQDVVILDEASQSPRHFFDLVSDVDRKRLSVRTNLVRQGIASTTLADNQDSSKSGAIDLTGDDFGIHTLSSGLSKARTILREGQKYTYGDSFSGGGGATRGALSAGLAVRWGFDHWAPACEGWKANFSSAKMFHLGADEVVMMGKRGLYRFKVDVLHLSPPCQFFSTAHTVAGKDDDMNSASLFAAGALLDVTKPRIATLEQTFGLGSPQFRHFHNSLIREFADRGYSIRWKTVALATWGLPQRRLRLIMIASCPGERLPPFPPQTHASPEEISKSNMRLKPFVTVNSVLRTIPANAPHHNPATVTQYTDSPKVPWNGDAILPRCMTTSGGQNYHPNGLREFTCAEYAALQGFPLEHKFPNTHVKKIIGNAVPPTVAKVLFSWIRKWLEEEDGVVREAIVLDD